ncbi:hypothetical protein ACIRQY_35370 [Streptomyces sp. NPDC101490]|uniref:hypothetical protein n=1 Tax=Streptomyces sp. NPDC101490 TaxID=3366143 RepID=UPI0037FE8DAE
MPGPKPPYVVPWKGETVLSPTVQISRFGVEYARPALDSACRDRDQILWAVCGGEPDGGPAYARELHPERQQEAMDGLLCAGCVGEPTRDSSGMLWVLPLLDFAGNTVWEGVRTVIPPLCQGCADHAKAFCPRLREGYVELRVGEAEPVGVMGTLHPRPGQQGRPDHDALVLYDSPDMPFTIARQSVRELRRTTVVAVVPAPS